MARPSYPCSATTRELRPVGPNRENSVTVARPGQRPDADAHAHAQLPSWLQLELLRPQHRRGDHAGHRRPHGLPGPARCGVRHCALWLCCQPPAPPAAAVPCRQHTSAVHTPPFSSFPPCCCHPCSYTYLNLDDGWSEAARVDGRLAANKAAFPSGMPALSSYIREKGLKFGIYGDAGSNTCAGFPGERER